MTDMLSIDISKPLPADITKRFRTAEMTSPFLQVILKQFPIAIIPTGSHEQHGPHLPFGTDAIIAKSIAEYAAANLINDNPILVTPLIPIGSSIEHLDYPGTLSLSSQTLRRLLTDMVDSIALAGIKKILIVNGHGGNQHVIGSILHEMTRKHELFITFTDPSRLMKAIYAKIRPESDMGGFHAGDQETSVISFLAPDLIDSNRIVPHQPQKYYKETEYVRLWGSKLIKDFGWSTKDIAPSGVIGDPSTANPDKGKILFTEAVKNLSMLIIEILTKI